MSRWSFSYMFFAFNFLLRDFILLLLFNYMCSFVHKFSPYRDWKKALEPLELELQVTVSYVTSLQGIEPGSFGRALCALNYWVVSSTSYFMSSLYTWTGRILCMCVLPMCAWGFTLVHKCYHSVATCLLIQSCFEIYPFSTGQSYSFFPAGYITSLCGGL